MEMIKQNDNITRIGGISAIICGVCNILGGLMVIFAFFIPVIPSLAWGALFTFSMVLIVFPLIAISYRLFDGGSSLAKAAYVVTLTGLLLGLSGFFSPLGWVIYIFGFLLLAAANMQNRQVSMGAMWLWFFCIVISIGTSFLNIPLLSRGIFPVISAAPIIWIGMSLLQINKE